MTMLLEFLERHRARHLFRSSHLKVGIVMFMHVFDPFRCSVTPLCLQQNTFFIDNIQFV